MASALAVPVTADAQTAAVAAPPPSYATPDETITGRISAISGTYNLSVRDDRGFIDSVTLHDGTVINPTGLRLSPGQTVTIHGFTRGGTFVANEVDTPYQDDGGVAYGYGDGYPYGAYYGYPYGGYYGYPYYGYGYPYGFGFGVGIGFGFGVFGGYGRYGYGHYGGYGRGGYRVPAGGSFGGGGYHGASGGARGGGGGHR
jgi:hypothetical protein